ncbi:MAG: BON domain-containing protein [Thermoguttaceae bacterium]
MNTRAKYVACVFAALIATFLSPPLVRAAVPDIDINYNVKDALLTDSRVDGSGILATTASGIVTLSGSVGNLAAKTYAVSEAKKINGVLGVIDNITVKPIFRWDTDISNAVSRRILNSAVIKSQGLSVACKDGVVTLSGTVASYSEEQQAGLLASEVRGVKEVKNNIVTKWSSTRSDLEIKNDAAAAIGRDVYLAGLPITVTVQDGIVSLSGSVGNAYEKDRAVDDVRWISNVTDVKNSLTVEWYENSAAKSENKTPADEALKQAVRNSLDQDSRIVANQITLRTFFGEVTLDGSVFSEYEKRVAEQNVKNVVGVGWVTNNLFVRADQREDWAIEDDVRFNLNTDAVMEGFGLGASVNNGIVTLTGKVHSSSQWWHAHDIASRVRGVKAVIDKIAVSEANDINGTNWNRDAYLVKSIKTRLRTDWGTWWALNKINVTVRNGVATLEGNVGTWQVRQEAGDLALHTIGISEVDNRLTVEGVAYHWDEHHYK